MSDFKQIGTVTVKEAYTVVNHSRYETASNYDIDEIQAGEHEIGHSGDPSILYIRYRCIVRESFVVSRLFSHSTSQTTKPNREAISFDRRYVFDLKNVKNEVCLFEVAQ